nr:hypothetical protein [uncultured Psychroserpens sp.]
MRSFNIKKDIIIISIIIVSPFAFYFHVLAPKTKIWETILFTIDAGYFEKINNYLWIYSYKILTILMVSIWFITCKNWWRLAILFPLSFEFSHFISFLNDRYQFLSNYSHFHSIPIFLIFGFLLFLISKKLNYYSLKNNNKSKLNAEIYELMKDLSLFDRDKSQEIEKQFNLLKKEKDFINKKDYLVILINLRDKMDN